MRKRTRNKLIEPSTTSLIDHLLLRPPLPHRWKNIKCIVGSNHIWVSFLSLSPLAPSLERPCSLRHETFKPPDIPLKNPPIPSSHEYCFPHVVIAPSPAVVPQVIPSSPYTQRARAPRTCPCRWPCSSAAVGGPGRRRMSPGRYWRAIRVWWCRRGQCRCIYSGGLRVAAGCGVCRPRWGVSWIGGRGWRAEGRMNVPWWVGRVRGNGCGSSSNIGRST